MNKILKFLKSNIFPLLILLICGVLAWKNYVPNTILSGWDTLHPEFNFWLYAKRALNGVWVEHQGLGAVASQSHPAELTRLLIYGLLSLVLPLNIDRYVFFSLCLVTGALGVYFFSKYILSIKWHKYVNVSAFLASLFYLFNLTTVQQFYVPLEMFAVHYALAPWLFLLGLKYIREKSAKTLIWFSLISLFASSMAHTATLFYVYLFSFGLFLVFQNFKKAFFLCLITVLINSFWILPNIYFIKNHSKEVSISKIHSNFTDEAFMQSQSFGDLGNLSLSKNFLFNWGEYSFKENKFVDLMDEWKLHLDKPYVKEIGYVLFGIGIFGFVLSIFLKSKPAISLFTPFLLSISFWINENPPLTNVFIYLRENFPLVKEGLRFPFTKFSLIYILVLSIWFGFSSRFIINLLGKVKLSFLYVLVIVVSVFYFQLPQFEGYLISPSMKVVIPSNYTDLFNWLNKQDENSRVAKFPLNSYWGWVYNNWGYQGAGFIWFGIKQPILEREFDRWSPYNESFYNEASYALYDGDELSFKKVLEKYEVRYLLIDESVINPGGDVEQLKFSEIKKIAEDLGFTKSFNSGFLTVYDTNIENKSVTVLNNFTKINADLTYSKYDPIYQKYGDYIQDKNGIRFPFSNLDNRGPVEIDKISEDGKNLLRFKNKNQNVQIKLQINDSIVEDFDISHGYAEANNCDLNKKGKVSREQLEVGRQYKAEDGGVACDYFVYNDLRYNTGYILHIKSKNMGGRSIKLYLYNWDSKRVELEELLPANKDDNYYVVYPSEIHGSGYTLNVETRSFGRIASENIVSQIEFIPFNLNSIQNAYVNPKLELQTSFLNDNLKINNIKKYGTAIYKVETTGSGVLELGQGYETGWVAYPKLEHTKINGWANGFKINSDGTYYIFFWPQFLEWGGFVVLLLTMVYLIVKSKKLS
jgi:hypothetical protein